MKKKDELWFKFSYVHTHTPLEHTLSYTHAHALSHACNSARHFSWHPALIFLISSISQEKSACQRLCPNNNKPVQREKKYKKNKCKTKKKTHTTLSLFINPSTCDFIIYLRIFGARYLNNAGYDEEGAVWKQQDDSQNHPRAHASTAHQCHPFLLYPCGLATLQVASQTHTHTYISTVRLTVYSKTNINI